MSNAANKNAEALNALFGDASLASRLTSTRIAVVTPSDDLSPAGALLARVTADTLARLWPNIDFYGFGAEQQLTVSLSATQSGGAPTDGLAIRWAPPYNCVIAIGCRAPTEADYVLQVGADNWTAEFGPDAHCGNSPNPIGPAFAAAMVSAQVFRQVFMSELSGMDLAPLDPCTIDVRTLFDASHLEVGPLNLGQTYMFGVGAVSHSFVWLLEQWSEPAFGELHLVDQDGYGHSNGQRYAFMRPQDEGATKVDMIRNRLAIAHPRLSTTPHAVDLNTFCANQGYDKPLQRAITGLDSAESRRHVALKLPETTINMWTEGVRIGAGRYLPGDGGACLACDYLEKLNTPLDEVAEISRETGIRPDLVRNLLDSGRGLTQQEAAMISAKRNVSPAQIIGEPLRSVMPTLCATGRLQLPNSPEIVDVPFAFASLFAGIAGFIMLLKDCTGSSVGSYGWTQHIFKKPTPHMHRALCTRDGCVCCAEMKHINSQ